MKKKIFSIALLGLLSALNAGVINKNGIAKDSATGLEWQDNSDAKTINKDWSGAKAYCENLTLGGKSDWRLPNIYELTTLLDNKKSNDPYVINGIENIVSGNYWSSTTDASNSSYAGFVYFYDGDVYWDGKTYSLYVRCVRAGQLNFDNLVILKNKGKLKVSQENIDKISPKEEKIKAQESTEREKQAKIREEQKFQLGNSVCYSGHTSNSGWCGSIENIRGDKIQVEITKININGFLSNQLNASECTGNKDIKYHDEGKLIWVSKSCVD